MTKSVKTALVLGLGAIVLLSGGLAAGIYYLADFHKGAALAQEGYLAGNRGDHDTALARLNEALRHRLTTTQRASAYVNRAIAFYSKSKFDEAIHDYTEAIRLNPKSAAAYVGRGFSHQQKGENEKAIADLTEALRYDPNSGSTYFNRGHLYFEKNEIDRALADFSEAIRCEPNNAEALVGRGLCYVAKNDLDHALASFDAAILVDPKNAHAYEERAKIYEQKGDAGKVAHDQAQARSLKLASPETTERKPQSFAANPPSSKLELSTLPGSGETPQDIMFKADRALKAGQVDVAIELANKILAMNIPAAPASFAVFFRGDAYLKKGDMERALGDYNESAVLDPMQFRAYLHRALFYARTKEFAKAQSDLEEIPRSKRTPPMRL